MLQTKTPQNPETIDIPKFVQKIIKIESNYQILCSAVLKSDIDMIDKLIKEQPKFINSPKPNQNILKFACLKDNKLVVSHLLDLSKTAIISKQQNFISETIIQCIRWEKLQIIKIFVEKGFDLNKIVFKKNQINFTCIDFAILGGHYQIAYYIYDHLNKQLKNLRNVKQFEIIGKKFVYRYVNYQMVVNGLVNHIPPNQIGPYLKKQLSAKKKQDIRRIYKQGCWEWLMRVLGFGSKKQNAIKQEGELQIVSKLNTGNTENTINTGNTGNIDNNVESNNQLKQPKQQSIFNKYNSDLHPKTQRPLTDNNQN